MPDRKNNAPASIPAPAGDLFEHLASKKAERVPLTQEQIDTSWRQLEQARKAIGDVLHDPTLAHNYGQLGSWRVWTSIANNTLIPGCSLSAHVNFTGQAMCEIVKTIVPNRAHGHMYGEEIARDHAELELKKAIAVNRVAIAGAVMMGDYPGTTPRHLHATQILNDHAVSSAQWMKRAAAAVKAARSPKSSKPVQAQQNLFSV